ncbi:hypothetical protein PILCRDRAFT_360893 [Piloderma croceum F 1598]|uniref:Uncharacterized protein n=1 Tax=Piloderma croceum (strain F 1598) TaxID=765440 RepID=A0A0C3G427_PILCF|nr:hypothetical protein PILCRDRAFT_360893 [Piloderma croceum F 1598]
MGQRGCVRHADCPETTVGLDAGLGRADRREKGSRVTKIGRGASFASFERCNGNILINTALWLLPSSVSFAVFVHRHGCLSPCPPLPLPPLQLLVVVRDHDLFTRSTSAMSLSRILNDDPSPAVLRPAIHSSMSVIDPALMSQTGPPPEYQGEPSAPPRSYQPTAYQGTGGWDPYSGEWVQGDIFPLGRGNGDYYSRPENSSSHDSRSAYYEVDGLSRKRRREPDEDDDYRPSELRQGRVSIILTSCELHL